MRGGPTASFRLRVSCIRAMGNSAAGGVDAAAAEKDRRKRGSWRLNQTRNSWPIFLPRIRLAPRMVTAKKSIAQTPNAAAMYLPVPMSWNSS